MRAALGLAAVLGVVVTLPGAGPPPRGRALTAEEQGQVRSWRSEVSDAVERSEFARAADRVGRVAELRERVQGAGHWEAVEARLEQESWLRVARLSARQQKRMTEVLILCFQARTARGRGQAEKLYRQALALCRSVAGEENAETASCYRGLAGVLRREGRYAEALPLARKGLESSRAARGAGHPSTGSGHGQVASLLAELGRFQEAQPHFEAAVAINRKALGEGHPDTAASYNNLANNLESLGRPAEAHRLYERAVAIHRGARGESDPDTLSAMNNLGLNLYKLQRLREAQPLLERVLAARLKGQGADDLDTAFSYNVLGGVMLSQGKVTEAAVLVEKGLKVREARLGPGHPLVANSCAVLASCYKRLEELEKARVLEERALTIYRVATPDNDRVIAQSYNNLALVLQEQGKPREALALLGRALELMRRVPGGGRAVAKAYANVGIVHLEQGAYAEARRAFEAGREVARKEGGDGVLAAVISVNLSVALRGLGEPRRAQALCEEALAVYRQAGRGESPEVAQGHLELGLALKEQGKFAGARKELMTAEAMLRRLYGPDHLRTAEAAVSVGGTWAMEGKYKEAAVWFRRSLTALDRYRLGSAATGFDRSLLGGGRDPLAGRQLLAGCLVRLGEGEEAWRQAEAALARGLLDDLGGREGGGAGAELAARLQSLNDRLVPLLAAPAGEARQRRDELLAERREVEAALQRRAVQASQRLLKTRQEIQKALPDDGALVMWLDVSFGAFGCVLRKEGAPRWAELPGGGAKGEWTKADVELPRRVYEALTGPGVVGAAERERRLAALRRQRVAPLEKYLGAEGKAPAVRRLFVVAAGPLASVPVELLAGGRTVSYAPSGSVLAQGAGGARPVRSGDLLALGDPAFEVVGAAAPPAPGHGLLLRVVVPGGSAARAGLEGGDVLLSYDGAKLVSLKDLRLASGRRVPARRWREGKEADVVLGAGPLGVVIDTRPVAEAVKGWREATAGVVRRGTGHKRLAGSRYEVESLRGLFGEKRTTLLLGSEASEQRLDELRGGGEGLRRYRVLHLATHGEVDWDVPQRSALILAQDRLGEGPRRAETGGKVYSGRLTVGAILRGWELDADLVVLSACQTGLGKDAGGEGLLGFAQAFLQKGARSVVLSRWKVDDVATALLMVRFYENLLGKTKGLKGAVGRAEALAEAKRWLAGLSRKEAEGLAAHLAGGTLRGTVDDALPAAKGKAPPLPGGDRPFAHPYYWAAFVLIGGPE